MHENIWNLDKYDFSKRRFLRFEVDVARDGYYVFILSLRLILTFVCTSIRWGTHGGKLSEYFYRAVIMQSYKAHRLNIWD